MEVLKGWAMFKLIPWTYIRWAGLAWFLSQAWDEVTRRNIWTEDTGPWEYIAFIALASAAWWLHKRSTHEGSDQGGDRRDTG